MVRVARLINTLPKALVWVSTRSNGDGLVVLESEAFTQDRRKIAVTNNILIKKANLLLHDLVANFRDTAKQLENIQKIG